MSRDNNSPFLAQNENFGSQPTLVSSVLLHALRLLMPGAKKMDTHLSKKKKNGHPLFIQEKATNMWVSNGSQWFAPATTDLLAKPHAKCAKRSGTTVGIPCIY